MTPRPVLEVRHLEKRYGTTRVLDGVSFTLHAGEMALVTGRSGSGKSTLFKLLAGLDRPDAGSLRVDGEELSDLDDDAMSALRLHRVGLVFQSYNLLPDLSVLENVRLPLDLASVPKREGGERALELMQLLGIDHLATKMPHQISGGEAQRAAIARALTNKPALVLADEPTGSLDRTNAENVLAAFETINRTLGTTLLVITHDPLAMARVPRQFHLEDGRLAPADAPAAHRH